MNPTNPCIPDDFWENSFSVNEDFQTKKDGEPPTTPLKGRTIGNDSDFRTEEKTKK